MSYSFKALEFDKIMALLSSSVKTYPGLLEIESLCPSNDIEMIRNEFKLVKETRDLIKNDTSLFFEEVGDITPSLEKMAVKGYILSSEELFEIKITLALYSDNLNAIQPHFEKYPSLAQQVNKLDLPLSLLNQLKKIIDDDGTVKDDASPELKRIRRRMGNIRSDIKNRLLRLMDNENLKEGVQDRLITIRDNRFVIPVRSNYKNKMDSIVHSFSKSGETAFVEPSPIIPFNNEMIELDDKERTEIRRILKEITLKIAERLEDIENIYNMLGRLESLNARAKFAIKHRAGFPQITEKSMIDLKESTHPLLMTGDEIIPVDIRLGETYRGMIISGPNAGGKTVALKTAGLLTIMALSGIPIPAKDDSIVGVFDKIQVEIGDDQSIFDNLSTFSGHIKNIAHILNTCDEKTLVLIDEIASSTEPKEGEALGRSIISELINKKARFIVTTHFQAIKELAYSNDDIRNAYMEFDEKRLQPLYRLHIGAAGHSYALKIAKRYGLPEEIITQANQYIQERITENDRLVQSIEIERNEISRKKEELASKEKETNRLLAEYRQKIHDYEKKIEESERKGVSELKRELDKTLEQLSEIKKNMKKNKIESVKSAEQIIHQAKDVLERSESEIIEREKERPGELFVGQSVYVKTFNKDGYIEDISGQKVKVRIGIISAIVNKNELFISERSDKRNNNNQPANLSGGNINSGFEYILNICGLRGDEAMKRVEKNLDTALISGQDEVIIIHGKGEGILRKLLWEYLEKLDFVASFNYAKPEEGGQGKTIITLK